MTKEPPAIIKPPKITFQLTVSPRMRNDNRIVNTTLNLSIGATLEASPNWNQRS